MQQDNRDAMKYVGAQVPIKVHQRFKMLAIRANKSQNQMIIEAIELYMAEYSKEEKKSFDIVSL